MTVTAEDKRQVHEACKALEKFNKAVKDCYGLYRDSCADRRQAHEVCRAKDKAMTESMIERMARAAFNAHSKRGEDHWASADPIQRETKIREMTSALMAMREPTETMKDAGAFYRISTSYGGDDGSFDYVSEDDAAGIFGLMIDAALQWPAGSADRAGVPLAED